MAAVLAVQRRRLPLLCRLFCSTHSKFSKDGTVKNFASFGTFPEKEKKFYDVVIVGGGIVGMATARELALRHTQLRMAVLEKEPKLAAHQSGHNSGVIHAGIYYKPGSLKAELCVKGLNLIYSYCDTNKIPYKKCGKLIVATNKLEVERLNELHERGLKNKVKDLKMIEKDEIKEIEPHCQGLKALHSPHTGIVDYGLMTEYYGRDFEKYGGKIHLNFEVTSFRESTSTDYPVVVSSKSKEVWGKYVLTCGGLYSDKLSEMSGCNPAPRIVPFRGEYLVLKPEKTHLVNGNIYPVPDPRFPFLGVHFTPRMDGSVWLGPNAVLAFEREGYNWWNANASELADIVRFSGFRKLAWKYLGYGSREMVKSVSKAVQVRDLRKFVPELRTADVERGPAGVRAQALDERGNLVDDFVFDVGSCGIGKRILHCRNAPSPGATSSLAIAELIADKMTVAVTAGLSRFPTSNGTVIGDAQLELRVLSGTSTGRRPGITVSAVTAMTLLVPYFYLCP